MFYFFFFLILNIIIVLKVRVLKSVTLLSTTIIVLKNIFNKCSQLLVISQVLLTSSKKMSRRMSMPTSVVDKPEKMSELKALFAFRMGSGRRSSLLPVHERSYGQRFSGSWVPRISGTTTNDVTKPVTCYHKLIFVLQVCKMVLGVKKWQSDNTLLKLFATNPHSSKYCYIVCFADLGKLNLLKVNRF